MPDLDFYLPRMARLQFSAIQALQGKERLLEDYTDCFQLDVPGLMALGEDGPAETIPGRGPAAGADCGQPGLPGRMALAELNMKPFGPIEPERILAQDELFLVALDKFPVSPATR